jgi:general stress protein 26
MGQPRLSRPYMPGYGLRPAVEGTGLLPWSWAEEKLTLSRNYWVVSVWPDGHPHAMPVWGMWHESALWFSSSKQSRKSRNLTADSRCVVATEDTQNPVVLEGTAELVRAPRDLATMLALENAKYSTDYEIEMLDPALNSSFRIRPQWVFGLEASDFTGSPTRWEFATSRKARTRKR